MMARIGIITMVVFAVLGMYANSVKAETLAYWRFEEGSFLDSSTNGYDLSATVDTGVPEFLLSESGAGSAFPRTIPLTREKNRSAVVREDGYLYRRADDGLFSITNNFTFECFINRQEDSTGTQFILSRWNTTKQIRCYGFGIAGTDRTPNYGVMLVLYSTSGSTVSVLSDLTISKNVDYYVAVSYDKEEGIAKFYVKDLTNDGPLQVDSVSQAIRGIRNSSSETFRVFCYYSAASGGGANMFNGVLDELRISNEALSETELLISGDSKGTVFMIL